SYSSDGKKMYFNSNRPIEKGGTRKERIWCAEKINGNWGDPFPLGSEIND
ncbi:MAG: PD40 domain-containing protein, partial [Bacteroidales bacterium]|nr:PD40 domain-containing protein [Bacteroidales bacterium]